MSDPAPGDQSSGREQRWRDATGIPVEAAFLRTFETLGGPEALGYAITPGLFVRDDLVQYFNHARLEAPGWSSSHSMGIPRLSDLGELMARGVLGAESLREQDVGQWPFGDDWHTPARAARAGPAVTPPRLWRGRITQWHKREIVRLLPTAPGIARPVAGHLGDAYVTLSDAERLQAEGRASPVARSWRPVAAPVVAPILTFHLVRDQGSFRAQVDALLDAGLKPISLDHLVAALEGWAELPERPVLFTFDDGWTVQIERALPVLVERRVPATFFVMPGFDRFGRDHMSLDQIRQVRAAGMTVASHTLDHANIPHLIATNLGAAQAETVLSRAELEREVDGVDFFAYPNGLFDDASEQLVRDSGYRAAVGTRAGIAHRPDELYRLRRVGVQAWWSFEAVREAIRAAARASGVDSPL